MKKSDIAKAIKLLAAGGIGIMPTDTIYGLVAPALNPEAVERVFRIRRRDSGKPPIILISSFENLKLFDMALQGKANAKTRALLREWWPGKVSVVLKGKWKKETGTWKKFQHLHRGTGTLAFRMPKPLWLRQLIWKMGPLIAPSANLQGEPPAKTIRIAKKYFSTGARARVDFYLDGGTRDSKPSTLVKIEKGKITILREGAIRIGIQESKNRMPF